MTFLKDTAIWSELHPTLNGDKNLLSGLTHGSNKTLWWQCDKGHEWEAKVGNRAILNHGCPYCSGKKILKGFNDLATTNPELIPKWDSAKNAPKVIDSVGRGSHGKYWWKCSNDHSWESTISYVASTRGLNSKSEGCPYCSGKKVLVGFNDLNTVFPEIATQWHPTKNGSLEPTDVTSGNNKKVWWVCDKNHEWETAISHRCSKDKTGCPYCSGQKVLVGFNDLATVSPELSAQWHPTKNGSLEPTDVTAGNNKKVWWQCDKGHEWEAKVGNRFYLNRGCPYCSNQKIIEGVSDFGSKYPELLKEWHPTKNGSLKPSEISAGTSKKIWWVCDKGHKWDTQLHHRTGSKKTGCPKCANIISNSEVELAKWIESVLKLNVVMNTRSVIKGELDIYIPEKNIAIEYNGLYWHSEDHGKDKNYHYNKWLACKEQGIQLIQIWEDDYTRNPELVKNMLAYKLGVSQQVKVYARNTTIETLTKQETDSFLNSNHIQGSVDGKIRVALFSDGSPVAVMVLKTESGSDGKVLNLLRYATSVNVVGGFTRLISWVEKNVKGITEIVTFSDNTVSDGGLYESNGFHVARIIKPDYMYIVRGQREHKFNYRLKRFQTDTKLQWVEGMSETELARLNRMPRIWDAGKTKWVKTLETKSC